MIRPIHEDRDQRKMPAQLRLEIISITSLFLIFWAYWFAVAIGQVGSCPASGAGYLKSECAAVMEAR